MLREKFVICGTCWRAVWCEDCWTTTELAPGKCVRTIEWHKTRQLEAVWIDSMRPRKERRSIGIMEHKFTQKHAKSAKKPYDYYLTDWQEYRAACKYKGNEEKKKGKESEEKKEENDKMSDSEDEDEEEDENEDDAREEGNDE